MLVRIIMRARELLLGADPSVGWGLLSEIPEREVLMGTVTQPWIANPVFRALTPESGAWSSSVALFVYTGQAWKK